MASRSPTRDHAVGAGTDRTSRRPGRGPAGPLQARGGAVPLRVRRSRSHRSSTTWCGRRRARPTSAGRRRRGAGGPAGGGRQRPPAPGDHQPGRQRGASRGAGLTRADSGAHRSHAGELLLDIHDDGPGIARRRPLRVFEALPAAAPRTAAPGWAWRSRAGGGVALRAQSRWSTRRPAAASGCIAPGIREPIPFGTSIFRSSRDDACPGGRRERGGHHERTDLTPPHPVPDATCGTGTATSAA